MESYYDHSNPSSQILELDSSCNNIPILYPQHQKNEEKKIVAIKKWFTASHNKKHWKMKIKIKETYFHNRGERGIGEIKSK
jgi:hypothetical protein